MNSNLQQNRQGAVAVKRRHSLSQPEPAVSQHEPLKRLVSSDPTQNSTLAHNYLPLGASVPPTIACSTESSCKCLQSGQGRGAQVSDWCFLNHKQPEAQC